MGGNGRIVQESSANQAAARMMTSLEEVLGKLSSLESDMKGVQVIKLWEKSIASGSS